MTHTFWLHCIPRLIALIVGSTIIVTPNCLVAQQQISLTDTSVDFSRYQSAESCLAATMRVAREITRQDSVWIDTMELVANEPLAPLSPQAVTVARTCAEQFDAASVDPRHYAGWVRLFLQAEREGAADTVVQRRLDEIAPDAIDERIDLYVALAGIYSESRPIQRERLQTALKELNAIVHPSVWKTILPFYGRQLSIAMFMDDDSYATTVAQQTIAFAQRMSDNDRHNPQFDTLGVRVIQAAYDFLSRDALRDSLKRGTQSYIALKRSNAAKASGASSETVRTVVGSWAEPIYGDFWFDTLSLSERGSSPSEAKALTTPPLRPRAGHPSLIVFLRGGCHAETIPTYGVSRQSYRTSCVDTYAIVRRFAKQFPTLDITLVTQTHGNLGRTPPIEPREEAKLLARLWIGFHQLPITLAVTNTPFIRLPDPDRRRIDRDVANNTNYAFAGMEKIAQKSAFIIDSHGFIIHAGTLQRSNEQVFRELLMALCGTPSREAK